MGMSDACPDPLPGPRQHREDEKRVQIPTLTARTHYVKNIPQIGEVFKRCQATTNKADAYNRDNQGGYRGRERDGEKTGK